MRSDFYFDSVGAGKIHCCQWMPDGEIKAVVQIVHGIAEYIERYDNFANYLNARGWLVVAEDHMGHGQSINGEGIQGYFHGGWFAAVADTYHLLKTTKAKNPDIPYVLFGHSMGSFITRSILCKYPDSGISAAVICGTGWQPRVAVTACIGICQAVCNKTGEQKPNEKLQNLVFGSYNNRVEHPRTPYDWLSRDSKIVDDYIAHPLCGFIPSCGLLRDMMIGIRYIERKENLAQMNKELPVLFLSGGDDPVGNYGKGVRQAAQEFRNAGMKHVSEQIYPLGRHEILNEINRDEVYRKTADWIARQIDI